METFRVWVDGQKSDAVEVEASDMNEALDAAADKFGYVDHADMAQQLGWTDSKLNIVVA